MRIAILSADPLFRAAAEGVAGAMGHGVCVAAAASGVGDEPLVVVDLATVDAGDLADFDPLRIAAFAPQSRPEIAAAARTAGVEVFARGALATELPRLIAQRT